MSLLIPSGTQDDPHKKHLFILLTNPQGVVKHVLMVSISSIKNGQYHDDTCILYVGDHDFIKHDSFVVYSLCRIETADKLYNGIKQNIFVYKGLIDLGVFERIRDGLATSPHTSQKVKNFFSESTQ